ncbi:MAG: hypothetical protein ACPGED_06375, partial [Flavobacteriales bacterium]
MKHLIILLFSFTSATLFSQVAYTDITGFWNAKALLGGQELRVEIMINPDYTGSFASPDQGGGSIAFSSLTYNDGQLNFDIEKAQLS